MLDTNNLIIKHKAGLLNLTDELSNASKVCKSWESLEIRFTVIRNAHKTVIMMR